MVLLPADELLTAEDATLFDDFPDDRFAFAALALVKKREFYERVREAHAAAHGTDSSLPPPPSSSKGKDANNWQKSVLNRVYNLSPIGRNGMRLHDLPEKGNSDVLRRLLAAPVRTVSDEDQRVLVEEVNKIWKMLYPDSKVDFESKRWKRSWVRSLIDIRAKKYVGVNIVRR